MGHSSRDAPTPAPAPDLRTALRCAALRCAACDGRQANLLVAAGREALDEAAQAARIDDAPLPQRRGELV